MSWVRRGCGNTFASACVAGAPYAFGFNQAVLGLDKLTVGPGADWVFTLGAFTPTVGAVPAGSYKLFSATVGVQVTGQQWVLSLDAGGLPMFDDQGLPVYRLQSTSAYLPLFDTCGFAGDSAADCALPFTRTVTAAVPEPSAAGLLLLGIGVGCAARRRKSGVASL